MGATGETGPSGGDETPGGAEGRDAGRIPGEPGRPAGGGPRTWAEEAGGTGRAESATERVNRQWQEILQETRVAQTGVQILFGFLLSVAFTSRFADLGTFDRTVYTLTVVVGAGATAALIAPVSIHRFLSGQRMKDEVVETAARLMMCGMVLLALTVGCTLLLILHVVLGGILSELLVGIVMVWFVCCWYVLPARLRRRSARRKTGGAGKEGRR